MSNPIVRDNKLIDASADEDYETDQNILRRTIQVCKRDCLDALKYMMEQPNTFQMNLHNQKFQKHY